jgi:hypothetical protein
LYLAIIISIVILLLAILVRINFADSNVPVTLRIVISVLILATFGFGLYYLMAPVQNSTVMPEVAQNPKRKVDTSLALIMPKYKTDTLSSIINADVKADTFKPVINLDTKEKIQAASQKIASKVDTLTSKPVMPEPKVDVVSTVEATTEDKQPNTGNSVAGINADSTNNGGRYRLKGKTFFYTSADVLNRSENFINYSASVTLTPLNERNGFIYVKTRNNKGKTLEGWLNKSDLESAQ